MLNLVAVGLLSCINWPYVLSTQRFRSILLLCISFCPMFLLTSLIAGRIFEGRHFGTCHLGGV